MPSFIQELIREQLEHLLDEERQAKKDEEIVRTLQARTKKKRGWWPSVAPSSAAIWSHRNSRTENLSIFFALKILERWCLVGNQLIIWCIDLFFLFPYYVFFHELCKSASIHIENTIKFCQCLLKSCRWLAYHLHPLPLSLQARILNEEWARRETLERLQEEQRALLDSERKKREEFERMQTEKEVQLRGEWVVGEKKKTY